MMPTDKEIEAAADAYLRVGSGGLRADFGGRDITIPFAYIRAKAALEAAEKVRAEATIQHIKDFEDSGGLIIKGEATKREEKLPSERRSYGRRWSFMLIIIEPYEGLTAREHMITQSLMNMFKVMQVR